MSEYDKVHRTAKVITCTLVVAVMCLAKYYEVFTLEVIAIIIWFFGVNPVAYLIEEVKQMRHRHKRL